jgi:glycyl-tRNA synthetase beta chain
LASRLDELKQLVFHERLGSVADRTIRLQSLMEALAKQMGLPQSQSRFIPTLAQLAKADLVTQMVREFPSLQGIMAAHYARWEGQPEEVVRALAEQYRPRTVNDPIPETVLGALLSLADRLDFLTGLFGMGYIPTSSADPYGLRRQALGVMRILTESYQHGISFKGLSIDRALESAIESWRLSGMASSADWSNLKMLKGFLWERFDWLAATKGRMQPEWIKAIRMSRCDDPSDAWHRLTIVQKAWGNPSQRLILLKAAKVAERTGRMVQAAKDDLQPGEVRPEAMRELVEKRLWDRWTALKPKVLEQIRSGCYWEGIELYSQLYPDIHEFFLKVFVMDEDPHVRKNRLTLMQEIHGTLSEHFADLSVLPLPKEIPDGSHEGIKGEVCV